MLASKTVSKKLDNYNEIIDSLNSLFPQNELYPIWLLKLMSWRKNVSFNAYYDINTYVGLSYTYKYKDLVFILYLGVNNKIQAKGYGSQILTFIKEKYKDCNLALNVEPLDSSASNAIQREKRFSFYFKNGFYDSNYFISDDINYRILSTSSSLDIKLYKKLLKRFSFSLKAPKILKASD